MVLFIFLTRLCIFRNHGNRQHADIINLRSRFYTDINRPDIFACFKFRSICHVGNKSITVIVNCSLCKQLLKHLLISYLVGYFFSTLRRKEWRQWHTWSVYICNRNFNREECRCTYVHQSQSISYFDGIWLIIILRYVSLLDCVETWTDETDKLIK